MHIYKRMQPLTDSLTQHNPGNSMEDWVTNFDAQIDFKDLISTKAEFCEIPSFWGQTLKTHFSQHNSTSNYLTMKKLHTGEQDLNTENSFLAVLEFSNLRDGKRREEKVAFRKIGIFGSKWLYAKEISYEKI